MKRSVLAYLLRKVRRRIPALFLMTAAHVGSALFGVIFALGTKNVINAAIDGGREDFIGACIQQAGIIFGILFCLSLYRYLHDRLAAELDRDWKRDILHGLLRGEYSDISKYHSGELINRLNNDVRVVNEGLLATFPGLAAMVTRLCAVVGVLFAMVPVFTVLMVLLGAVVIVVTGLMRRKLRDMHKDVSAAEGLVSSFQQEALEKLMLVQAMGVEREMERRDDILLDERYRLQRRKRKFSLLANTCVSSLAYVSSFVALIWCAFEMHTGVMSFGELTAITQLVSQLQGPMVNLSGFLPKYIAMTAACERLMEIDLLFTPDEDEECDSWALYSKMKSLKAENLSFSYDRDMVLCDSTFELPKGAFAVVCGPSGIGKSTLLKLMMGIFRLDSGRMFIECEQEEIELSKATRRLFAYVPQGNLIFSGTLRENLTLIRPDAGEDEIDAAVRASGMDLFLSNLPAGLDTMLGENAHGLSEGQAQRLAIARAVLGGAPILLLDEATSALDAETEQIVLKRIRELPERTCITVTHRTAALTTADWLLEVEGGSISCRPCGKCVAETITECERGVDEHA